MQAQVGADGRLTTRFAIPEDFGGVHEVFVSDGGTTHRAGWRRSQPDVRAVADGGSGRHRRSSFASPASAGGRWKARGSSTGTIRKSASCRPPRREAPRWRGFVLPDPWATHTINVLTGLDGSGIPESRAGPQRVSAASRASPSGSRRGARRRPRSMPSRTSASRFPPQTAAAGSAVARMTPTQGPVNSKASLTVTGLPADSPVTLVWGTQQGNRVSGSGFEATEKELARVTVDSRRPHRDAAVDSRGSRRARTRSPFARATPRWPSRTS